MLKMTKFFAIAVLVGFMASCSQPMEKAENNNPQKYQLYADVLWASPDAFELAMDIYVPNSELPSLPVLVMFHGGGWLINDKSIMDQAAAYLATNSKYVICNVDYRLLSDRDNTVSLNQIVEDVFGAVLWVKENIDQYQGDPDRVAVTGDSAGAHLSAMIVNSGDQLSAEAFSPESVRFNPSYMPEGETPETIAEKKGLTVQAAILSYGAFDVYQSARDGFEGIANPFWLFSGSLPRGVFGKDYDITKHPEMYKAVSPAFNVPSAPTRKLPPQLLTAGSEDILVTPQSVKAYAQQLSSAGHQVQYWEYEGKSHAFLDSGSNVILGSSFEADAPIALDRMIAFLDEVFEE